MLWVTEPVSRDEPHEASLRIRSINDNKPDGASDNRTGGSEDKLPSVVVLRLKATVEVVKEFLFWKAFLSAGDDVGG